MYIVMALLDDLWVITLMATLIGLPVGLLVYMALDELGGNMSNRVRNAIIFGPILTSFVAFSVITIYILCNPAEYNEYINQQLLK